MKGSLGKQFAASMALLQKLLLEPIFKCLAAFFPGQLNTKLCGISETTFSIRCNWLYNKETNSVLQTVLIYTDI